MARRDKLWSFCTFCHLAAVILMTCVDKLWSSVPFVNREERIQQYQDDVGHSVLIIFKIFAGAVGGDIDWPNGVLLERN